MAMAKFLVCILLLVVSFDFIVSVARGPKRPTSQVNRARPSGNKHPIQPGRSTPKRPTCRENRASPYGNQQPPIRPAVDRMLDRDGNLHLYALPVGQGNSLVLQCPNGDVAIIDLGSKDGIRKGFWLEGDIQNFLQGHNHRIKNIVITHNDDDHYKFFSKVFPSSNDLIGLSNIYISRTINDMPNSLRNWINNIGALTKLRTYNAGQKCGLSYGQDCGEIILCPGDQAIETTVLSANAAKCERPNANIDSIVIGIKFNDFTMQLNGDFEDCTPSINEDGPQKKMADYYTSNNLHLTVYMLAHHGAASKANKRVLLDAVQPKAVIISSNPWFTYRHPMCSITDYLIEKRHLCKPGESVTSSSFYCGQHPRSNLNLNAKLQKVFSCGDDPPNPPRRCDYDNKYAIYSTTPSEYEMNLVHLLTDGDKWGFINDIQPRISR